MLWSRSFHMCCSSKIFFFKQKTAYEMRISDWSSDVCSSDLASAQRQAINEPSAKMAPNPNRRREKSSPAFMKKTMIKTDATENMKAVEASQELLKTSSNEANS